MSDIDEKLADDKQDIAKTKDPNPSTWINEDLWKKVLFKLVGYLVYVCGLSIVTVPIIGWNWTAFLIGLQTIILPIIWAAFDAQSRNKEIQQRLILEEKQAVEKKEFTAKLSEAEKEIEELKDQFAEKQKELYEVKYQLNVACMNVDANKEALKVA